MPCLDILIALSLTPGAKLGTKIGTKFSILIMVIFHIISYIILIFGTKFYIVIISISVFGFGMGLSYLTFMRNCWKYFPDNKGFVNGVIISSSGIFSTFLTILVNFLRISFSFLLTITIFFLSDKGINFYQIHLYIILFLVYLIMQLIISSLKFIYIDIFY